MIPAFGSQKQEVEVSSEASLVYIMSDRSMRTMCQDPVSKYPSPKTKSLPQTRRKQSNN